VLRERWAVLLTGLAADPGAIRPVDPAEVARWNESIAATTWPRRLTSEQMQEAAENLLKLAQAAFADDRLGRLFPFKSMSRLCFSRCSEWPYTNDCPAIHSARGTERYTILDRPYGPEGSIGILGDTAFAGDAVEMAAAALPPDAAEIWVGSLENKPGA